MESSNSIPSRKRPVKWIGYCARCDTSAETIERSTENPHPAGMFCPYENGGGMRGVMNFIPSEDQMPIMLAEDIGLDSTFNQLM